MTDKDITNLVEFDNNDDESLSLKKCACGERFYSWTFTLSIYRDSANECPKCGRKLYFSCSIRVFEVADQ